MFNKCSFSSYLFNALNFYFSLQVYLYSYFLSYKIPHFLYFFPFFSSSNNRVWLLPFSSRYRNADDLSFDPSKFFRPYLHLLIIFYSLFFKNYLLPINMYILIVLVERKWITYRLLYYVFSSNICLNIRKLKCLLISYRNHTITLW